jgi:glycosyltransferase involved in cell wall biosynthesis
MIKKKPLIALGFLVFCCISFCLFKAIKQTEISQRPDVTICGPIVMADGIGRQTAELALALSKKYKVQIQSRHVDKTDLPAKIKKLLKKSYSQPAHVVIVEESLWAPGEPFDRFFSSVDGGDQIRLAYSMLESTRIIPEWVMMMNLYFDAIIVPDPFLIDAYVNSGVTLPVFHIPLGIDIEDFLKAPLKKPKTKGPLVFGCLGNGIERKNHKMIIQAFAKALGNHENAWLYINCRSAVPEVREEILNEINKQNCNNIRYTEICLKKDAYLKFFSSIDCLLSFSKGEGFSIQPREAMALGIPTIVTDNTAQTTICNSGLTKVVASSISEPCYYFGRQIPDGERFNCALEECVAAIQDVYLNYSQYASKGPMMRKWASAYSYSHLSRQYESLVAPKKVILGDVNEVTPDYIITTSQELYNKYMRLKK